MLIAVFNENYQPIDHEFWKNRWEKPKPCYFGLQSRADILMDLSSDCLQSQFVEVEVMLTDSVAPCEL
jgi:hypothetical protein